MNSTELWRNHFPSGLSYKLRDMKISSCDTPLVLFSPHLIQGFHHLEKLFVRDCKSLEVVFDLEELIVGGGEHKVEMLDKLDLIHLEGLRCMKHVWNKVPKNFEGGFHNITSLCVGHCDSLRYLFSCSIAKHLAKLRKVQIHTCLVMEEVVSKRDEEGGQGQQNAVDIVFFVQIQVLNLYNLPSLMDFGPAGACAFDKLSLDAPNVGSSETHQEGNANTSVSTPFFSEKIAMTSLGDIEIKGANSFIELWHDHFASGFSYGIRKMSARSCNKLLVLFPPHLIQGFRYLEELKIEYCKSLELVFELEELTFGRKHKVVLLKQLAKITLSHLPRMTHIWKKVLKYYDGFHNLTSVQVMDCDSLRYLFSPMIAKCLVRLRKLSIIYCEKMEEVVSECDEESEVQENSVDMIFFPELDELELKNLPSLMRLEQARANYAFAAPLNNVGTDETHYLQGNASSSISTPIFNEEIATTSLEYKEIRERNSGFSYGMRKMTVESCKKLQVLFPPHLVKRFRQLEELKIKACMSLEVVFEFEELIDGRKHKIVLLEQLEEITLSNLPRMTHVWKKVPKYYVGFHNLTSVQVMNCDSLRYLFSPMIAKCLVRLQKLSIIYCEKMEEVVSECDEESEVQENSVDMIFFPELDELELKNLPSLMRLVPARANYAFGKLSYAAALNNVGTETHDLQGNASSSISTPIFNEEIATTSLEYKEIRGKNSSIKLSRDNFARGSSYGRKMSVESCNKLQVLFPPHLVKRFRQLEELKIKACMSLEVVFEFEELIDGRKHKIVLLEQLEEITLSNLPRMTHVWKKVPKYYVGFHNLTSVQVMNCDSLRYLFSPLIAKCLLRLRKLSVIYCKKMEEVVSECDEESEVQENSVDMILFPELDELDLKNLPSLMHLVPARANYAFRKLSYLAVLNNVGTETHDLQGNASSSISTPIFNEEIATTSLEYKEIRGTNSSIKLSRDNFARGFSYGRKMSVESCNKLQVLSPPHLVKRFRHLEELKIEACMSLEVVFEFEELIDVRKHKIAMLEQLAMITLSHLPRMTHVWKNVPKYYDGFHNLTSVQVMKCDSLRYLFSPLIAKCLVRLRKLSIIYCKKMEEVVSECDEESEVQENSVDMILFPELVELEHKNLPSLTRLVPAWANYAFGKLSYAAALNNVGTKTHDLQGNASSSISTPIFNEEIATTSLEYKKIRGRKLRKMSVESCKKLQVLFPPHLVKGFCHLEQLNILECMSLEVVFELEELIVGRKHNVALLEQLAKIALSHLPRMTHVWKKVPKYYDGFHNLTSVRVTYCDSLRYLFSPLMAKCLLRLRELSIIHCKRIEEVVSECDEENKVQENSVDLILFPELYYLKLSQLPSLTSFRTVGANYAFDKQSFGAPPNNVATDETHDQGNASSSTSTAIFNQKMSLITTNKPLPLAAIVRSLATIVGSGQWWWT
ncbi:hypothetical protein LguiA_007466 [Lonicera macranthoides]